MSPTCFLRISAWRLPLDDREIPVEPGLDIGLDLSETARVHISIGGLIHRSGRSVPQSAAMTATFKDG